uniref:Uncharacterized protein n=1 Tax=viral metagenome TaxID=1070528 RepID=A0A6C0IJK7_9ZZZZ
MSRYNLILNTFSSKKITLIETNSDPVFNNFINQISNQYKSRQTRTYHIMNNNNNNFKTIDIKKQGVKIEPSINMEID